MNLQLYPWQKECRHAWFEHGCRGIAGVVTGAGKTVMALSAMEELRRRLPVPLRVKIIVPQTFLTSQWSCAMQKLAGIPRCEIGCYHGTHKDSTECPNMIYVINSARYTLSRHILRDINMGYAVLLIADECHHYAGAENRKIFEFLPYLPEQEKNFFSLGLSATPRTDGYEQYLIPALGPEIYRYTYEDAAIRSSIRPFVIFNIALTFTPEEHDSYQELSDRLTLLINKLYARCPYLRKLDHIRFFHTLKHLSISAGSPHTAQLAQTALTLSYQRKSVVYNAAARTQCTLRLIEKLSPASRILIFGERIEQADSLYKCLSRIYPNQTGRYHSQMEPEARKAALDRYRSGENRILVTCRALDEGFDIPSANIGIVLSSSSGERQRIQRLGRILRNFDGKRITGLYYLYMESSSEPSAYMPETETEQTCYPSLSLAYDSQSGRFVHPEYEARAHTVLTKLKNQEKDPRILDECRRCLSLGLLRPDWLMPEKDLEDLRKNASGKRMENYWICMKLMHQML